MATQGMVSVTKNGKMLVKAVAGCNGYNAGKLAAAVRRMAPDDVTAESVFAAAKEAGFGEESCLVVSDATQHLSDTGEAVSRLYGEKFEDPRFNPRWESGEPEHLEIVEL